MSLILPSSFSCAMAPWDELDNLCQYFELFDSFSGKFKTGSKGWNDCRS